MGPEDAPGEVEGGDDEVLVGVDGGVDDAVGDRDPGVTVTQAVDLPEELGAALGPLGEQAGLSGAVVAVPNDVFSTIDKEITISYWVNYDINCPDDVLIFDNGGAEALSITDCSADDGCVNFEAGGDITNWAELSPADYNQWHHYAVVKNADEGVQNIYYDGELVGWNREALSSMAGIEGFIIGRAQSDSNDLKYYDWRHGWKMYMGRLDDFRIYDYALSQAEILSLAGLSDFDQPVPSDAELYIDQIINFKDHCILLSSWLDEELWP